MTVTVYLSDGERLHIGKFDPETALDLRASLSDDVEPFLTFEMDAGTVVVARTHIVRIDFD